MPSSLTRTSPFRCPGEPLPVEPYSNCPGLLFAYSTNSGSVFTGSDGVTITATPVAPKLATGTRSFSGLKPRFGIRLTFADSDVIGSPRTQVYPSGPDLTTCSVPMLPPAPG